MRRDNRSSETSSVVVAPAIEDRSRARSRAAGRRAWLLRLGGALVLALTFGYVPYHLYARSGFATYLQLREDLQVRRARNARLRLENARLMREVEALRSDLRAIERVARAELGWVQPGEVVFDFAAPPAASGGDR